VSEDEVTAPIRAAMPLGDIPTVEDVAEAALFLCSERARMITGQTLYVNAGNFMT
jgi:enoyl-[acyl-carrier-protein] reductase (NADH)